jgi:hypothetical protein
LELGVRPQEAQDVAAGENAGKAAAGDHWQLIDVLAAHEFKRL